ncbi:MAG: DUF2157 domain-containing protein [bacterium]|nr:DUF2157 domain-containing protein [bacterium]
MTTEQLLEQVRELAEMGTLTLEEVTEAFLRGMNEEVAETLAYNPEGIQQELEKTVVLNEITNQASNKQLTMEILVRTIHLVSHQQPSKPATNYESPARSAEKKSRKFNFADVLYWVGGVVIFSGILIFVRQQWHQLESFARIALTLGSAAGASLAAVALANETESSRVEQAFQILAALLFPMGISVTFYEFHLRAGENTYTLATFILAAGYTGSYLVGKKHFDLSVATIYSCLFGFGLFGQIVSLFFDESKYTIFEFDQLSYRLLLLGIAVFVAGYVMAKNPNHRKISNGLDGLGTLCLLNGMLLASGFDRKEVGWDLIFPLVMVGVGWFSVYLQSRLVMRIAAFYLVVYLMKITGQYFSGAIGWPTTLIICGFIVIGVGYATHKLTRSYIPRT